ncbi:hypothetical protein CXB51_002886 [Gossypium anomalum]|uniref:BSD2 cysteine rich domain-containing protein n=1 Tax=Gossypium anomalum TaxID=47600 RepID=A0A8J6DBA3_9ROSI|nr:hypothetical protein CXB51_002886 [Gossypium anomalum]
MFKSTFRLIKFFNIPLKSSLFEFYYSKTTNRQIITSFYIQLPRTGVNSVDHFNGQFKAGGLCWLCRGKREILCGNCNGAGFTGRFMSTLDD